jgi:ketosteroid isomerase-like protein
VTVLGSVYRGREGVAKAIRRWNGTWSDWKMEVAELIDVGDRVLAVVRASGRGKGSGVDVAQQTFWTFGLRDRQIVHETILLDRAEALKAVGLRD